MSNLESEYYMQQNYWWKLKNRTIKFNEIADIWKDKYNKPIQLDKNSTLFTKIQEMEIKETLNYEINLNKIKQLEKEIQGLKNQICVQSLKLKNRNHG